jgi:DNA-binding phage protein
MTLAEPMPSERGSGMVPDPYPVAALLRAAVDAHCARTGESAADVARAAGLIPQALYRATRDGSDARPATVRAVCRALGLRVVLVPDR